jgi:lipopolysaccharide biosynthesis regulator YciM
MLESPSPLEADCDYLIASCTTRKVLSFFRPDEKIHWSNIEGSDPFMGIGESALLRLIAEGTDKTRRSVLGPMLEPSDETTGFDATCWRAPLNEVMHRFETQSGLDVSWVAVGMPVRRRPVTMFLRGASAQRVSEVACGVVELVANFTGSGVMVHDIRAMNSVAQARGLLTRQAVSAWRQFFLRRPDDPRVAHGHLALARLCEAEGDRISAVREYQLIAERYRDHEAAPEAMMRSAKLKIRLLDYDGARKDLLNLLDSYPDFHATDQLYLSLGNATLEAGLYDEAAAVYRKLYYLNLSPETQAAACLGIGRCMVQNENWDEAIRWLGRYIGRTGEQGGDDLVDGMCLMARAHIEQGSPDEALKYLYPAISLKASGKQNIRATLALADVEILKDNLVRAVGAVGRIPKRSVPEELLYDYYRVKSEVYAGMGLFNRALSELREGINGTEDLTLRARLGVQVGKIYVQAGELKSALRVLTDVVGSGRLPTGPIAQSAACDLGRVCVDLGKANQAVSAVRDVLTTTKDKKIRARARDILGTAYAMRKEFNKSAAVLSGRAEENRTGGSQ